MIIENPESLRAWLTTTLEPICDADPAALAKYVLALLKKPKDEADLKELCVEQLDVFLQKETRTFVESLFVVIGDKSYLPPASAAAPPPAAPVVAKVEPPAAKPAAPVEQLYTSSHGSSNSRPKAAAPTSQVSPSAVVSSSVVVPASVAQVAVSSTKSKEQDDKKQPIRLKRSPIRTRSSRSRSGERSDAKRASTRSGTNKRGGGGTSSAAVSSSSRRADEPPQERRPGGTKDDRGKDGGERRKRGHSPPPGRKRSRSISPRQRTRGGGGTRRGREKSSTPPPQRTRGEEELSLDYLPDSTHDQGEGEESSGGEPSPVPPAPGTLMAPGLASVDGGQAMSVSSPAAQQQPDQGLYQMQYGAVGSERRERCRDYDQKGFCLRGDTCPYDHGPDPVVVKDSVLPSMIHCAPPAMPPPNFSMPPPPIWNFPGHPGHFTSMPPGSYSVPPPVLPAPMRAPIVVTHQMDAGGVVLQQHDSLSAGMVGDVVSIVGDEEARLGSSSRVVRITGPRSNLSSVQSIGGGPPPKRRAFDRLGPIPGPPYPRPPADCCTLEVRKIPEALNNIATLNEHFSTFGNIVNIQVRYGGDPSAALITYANRHFANVAYHSTAPILNNRFIRMFWHNPNAQQQQENAAKEAELAVALAAGTSTGDASFPGQPVDTSTPIAPAVPSLSAVVAERESLLLQKIKKQERAHEVIKQRLELQKRKTELFEKQLKQQTLLLAQLEKCTDPAKKKELLNYLKALTDSTAKLKAELMKPRQRVPSTAKATEKEAGPARKISTSRSSAGGESNMPQRLSESKDDQRVSFSEKAPDDDIVSSVKRSRELKISGFSPTIKDQLMQQLKTCGEVSKMEYNIENQYVTVAFRTRQEAELAFSLIAKTTDWGPLSVTWVPAADRGVSESGSEVREQMSAQEIMANLDDEDSTDDEDIILNNY